MVDLHTITPEPETFHFVLDERYSLRIPNKLKYPQRSQSIVWYNDQALFTESVDPVSVHGRLVIQCCSSRGSGKRYYCSSPQDPDSWFPYAHQPIGRMGAWTYIPIQQMQNPVLSREESDEAIGHLSIGELSKRIHHIWGGIVPLEVMSSSIATEWLSHFINYNHDFGIVHAWVSALRTWTRYRPVDFEHKGHIFPTPINSIWSFPGINCVTDDGNVLSGLIAPSVCRRLGAGDHPMLLPSCTRSPRRIWDVCANRVIPYTWLKPSRCVLDKGCTMIISHAWVAYGELEYIITPVNGCTWPVPLPKGIDLEHIRQHLLGFNVHYAWLDILCLRQNIEPVPGLLLELGKPYTCTELVERRRLQLIEWATDVPLIGAIYRRVKAHVLVYLSGLGKPPIVDPAEGSGWRDSRHWLRRAWTMQEVVQLEFMDFAGLDDLAKNSLLSTIIPELGLSFQDAITLVTREGVSLHKLLWSLKDRFSSNTVDCVASLLYFWIPHGEEGQGSGPRDREHCSLPVYRPEDSMEQAWERLVSTASSIWVHNCSMNFCGAGSSFLRTHEDGRVYYEPAHLNEQLLTLFPHPSAHHWFPSWNQLMSFPDVSVQEKQVLDDIMPVRPQNCSLRLRGGRLYTGMRLEQTQMVGNCGEVYIASVKSGTAKSASVVLRALPGAGRCNLNADETFVLIDITAVNPRYGGRPVSRGAHPILVCRELTRLEIPTADLKSLQETYEKGVLDDPNQHYQYRLRRITTLWWDVPEELEHKYSDHNSGRSNWLPFEPDLGPCGLRLRLVTANELFFWNPHVVVTLQ